MPTYTDAELKAMLDDEDLKRPASKAVCEFLNGFPDHQHRQGFCSLVSVSDGGSPVYHEIRRRSQDGTNMMEHNGNPPSELDVSRERVPVILHKRPNPWNVKEIKVKNL